MAKSKMNVLGVISISAVVCAGVVLVKELTNIGKVRKKIKSCDDFISAANRYRFMADAIDRGEGEWSRMSAENREKLSRHYRLTSLDFIDCAINSL